jgi:C4-type Zn-finger protein
MRNADVKYSARYTMAHFDGGYRYTFYCAMCGYRHTTGVILAESEAEALALAEKEARLQFNGCKSCGNWVCDKHFNMNELMCSQCAPL